MLMTGLSISTSSQVDIPKLKEYFMNFPPECLDVDFLFNTVCLDVIDNIFKILPKNVSRDELNLN